VRIARGPSQVDGTRSGWPKWPIPWAALTQWSGSSRAAREEAEATSRKIDGSADTVQRDPLSSARPGGRRTVPEEIEGKQRVVVGRQRVRFMDEPPPPGGPTLQSIRGGSGTRRAPGRDAPASRRMNLAA